MKNKFLSVAASTAIVASALVFTGCGDSDSSSSTSSTSSTGGSSTATFFKGAWEGIPYYLNGASTASGSTAAGGNFSYSGDANVTFDLGLMGLKYTNVTSVLNNGVAYAAQAQNTETNATVTATELGNLLGVLAAFGINETVADSTKLSTIITALSQLKDQDASKYNASNANLDVDQVVTGIAAKTGLQNSTTPIAASTAYNRYVAAAANKMQTAGSSVANLNTTFLSNKAVFLSDGTLIAFNSTTHSQNPMVANINSDWAASGAFINLTGSTGNDSMSFAGPLAKGTSVTLTNGTGYMRTLSVAGVGYFLNSTLGGTVNTSVNKTLTLGGTMYTFQVGGNSTFTNDTWVNGTLAGTWTLPTAYDGFAVNVTNASLNGAAYTIAIDSNPATSSTSTVATIWNGAVSTVSALVSGFIKFLTGLVSA